MSILRRREPLISVVVPAYDVAAYLPACLDSILAQTHRHLEVIVVDDGSPDESGAIAEEYAARDPRVRVVHTENRGLGAARNEGLRHATGTYLAFADSDDLVPPTAYAVLLKQLRRVGADFVTGDLLRRHGDRTDSLRWMNRLHRQRLAVFVDQHPEILGDVFAWNKLFHRGFWDGAGLAWLEGVRYEDQPTTTAAYLRARRFAVIPDVVYEWRVRDDGSSITQQRASIDDLRDRWATKRATLDAVEAYGAPKVLAVVRDQVLPGDLHRYFAQIPDCPDQWWAELRAGIVALWGSHSLTHSGLTPAFRLVGWLVEQDRRDDAAAVVAYVGSHPGPLPRVPGPDGRGLVGRVASESSPHAACGGSRYAPLVPHGATRPTSAISLVE
jgi:CDP-glycerol glycerophosphotransferase